MYIFSFFIKVESSNFFIKAESSNFFNCGSFFIQVLKKHHLINLVIFKYIFFLILDTSFLCILIF